MSYKEAGVMSGDAKKERLGNLKASIEERKLVAKTSQLDTLLLDLALKYEVGLWPIDGVPAWAKSLNIEVELLKNSPATTRVSLNGRTFTLVNCTKKRGVTGFLVSVLTPSLNRHHVEWMDGDTTVLHVSCVWTAGRRPPYHMHYEDIEIEGYIPGSWETEIEVLGQVCRQQERDSEEREEKQKLDNDIEALETKWGEDFNYKESKE